MGDKNYARAFGATYAINAALPEKYQIKISTEKYEALIKTDVIVICGKCTKETNKHEIQVVELILTSVQNLILDQKTEKIWVCACGYENSLARTKMKQTKLNLPSYLQVVPEPPLRRDGLLGRLAYHNKAEQWVWLILEELEYSLTTFRDDYLKANKAEMGEFFTDDDMP